MTTAVLTPEHESVSSGRETPEKEPAAEQQDRTLASQQDANPFLDTRRAWNGVWEESLSNAVDTFNGTNTYEVLEGTACCGIRRENGLSILLSRTNHVAHPGTISAGADMTNQGRDEKMRLALVPPKPKEFVMAYIIGIGAARCTFRLKALSASGAVRFIVGGAT